jgi:hypothetical protein
MQTSPSNSYLSSILAIDKATNLGQRPLQITDLSGGLIMFWPFAWIKKAPDVEFGKDIGERAWVFETDQVATEQLNGDFLPG